MEPATMLLLSVAVLVCAYMAWNIGANDVANAMGTSVGSGALTVWGAILVAGIFEFCGAFFAGGHVTDTVRKGMLDLSMIDRDQLIYGMLASLAAAGTLLVGATRFGLPVSTTHSIVGANSLITERKTYPSRSLILGSPAKVVRALTDEEVGLLEWTAANYSKNAAYFRDNLRPVD